ncbi:MAG TPA: CHAD domain-containing protein [Terriglobales bacterium]|nr:CHAD domain-containing protein [Terriglobales bacterium]
MAQTLSLPSPNSDNQPGLEKWMDRVLKRAQKVRKTWDADDIHDLRVALRRCRTMAEALSEANPSPGWNKLKKQSKKIFHTLGEVRDIQIEQDWTKKLAPQPEPIRAHLLKALRSKEKERVRAAGDALEGFDRKEWRRLSRKLPAKAEMFPLESVVFQRLALAKLNNAVALYEKAHKRPSSIGWHRVRIAIKHFRYIVENFLPQHYEAWAADLKEMQDLLGEVHDLDVLRADVRRLTRELDRQSVAEWLGRIEGPRTERLEKFLSKTNGKESLWLDWRSGLQGGKTLLPVLLDGNSRAAYSAS